MAGTELKVILAITSLITLAGGVLILYFSITQLNNYKDLWQQVDQNVQKYAMYSLCAFGGIVIISGLIGIIGVLKRNRCLLAMFNILSIVLCACFIGTGVGITIFTNNQYKQLKDTDCQTQDSKYDWLRESNEFYQKVGTIAFCSPFCKCYVKNKQDFPAQTFDAKQVSNVDTDPVQFQQCKLPQEENQYSKYLPLVELLENRFQCAGICDPVPYYVFTDINRGPPIYTSGCKQRIEDFYEKYGEIVRIVAFATGGFFFLQILLAIWLCCMKKSTKNQDHYNRIYN